MQRKLTLSQLELLLAIEACGSIGGAARQQRLTQSAASQSLTTLEKTLGLPLFTRNASGAVSTAFAQSILQDARQAVSAAQRIVQIAERAEKRQRRNPTRFSIAAIPSIADTLLPKWSRLLHRLYPDLKISLYQGTHLEVSDWVKLGITDAGINALKESQPESQAENLQSSPLKQETLLITMRRDHPLMKRQQLTLQDAALQTIIMAAGSEHIMLPIFEEAGLPAPQSIRTQDVTTALNMVRQGLGITILAEKTFPQADFYDLRLRAFEPSLCRTLQLIRRADNPHEEACAALVKIITGIVAKPENSSVNRSAR